MRHPIVIGQRYDFIDNSPLPTFTMPKQPTQPEHRSKRLQSIAKAAAPKSPTKQRARKHPTRKTPASGGDNQDDSSQAMGAPNPEDTAEAIDPDPMEADPARVERPVSALVNHSLKNAWKINQSLPMCFVFDAVSPSLKFKRGMPFNDAANFPEYQESEAGNVTDTNGDSPAWMPYMHDQYQ